MSPVVKEIAKERQEHIYNHFSMPKSLFITLQLANTLYKLGCGKYQACAMCELRLAPKHALHDTNINYGVVSIKHVLSWYRTLKRQ